MAIRWISGSRLSMQRLGFCKAVLAFSELARTPGQMADVLCKRLEEQKFTFPYDEAFATWLKGLDEEIELNPEIVTSLQKRYIYGHPSRTGWLSKKHGFNEYAEYLPRHLGLVTASCERTDMGLVLYQGLMSKEQLEAFDHPSDANPLVLERGEQVFFLYNLLAIDGNFLIPFCEVLLNRFSGGNFNYLDAGSIIPGVMEIMGNSFLGSAYNLADQQQLQILEKGRQQILKNIEEKAEVKGSGSRREQTTIPRLEWLVDVGAVELVGTRTWRFSELGLKLISLAQAYAAEMKKSYPENVIGALLDSWFFEFVAQAYGKVSPQEVGRDEFLSFIGPGYKQLAGVGGYCLLRPLLLYSNILSLCDSRGLFLEYDRATRLLEDIYQLDPTALHYTIDRYNTDYQIRLESILGEH
jgi:hypothetical protein